MKMKKKWLSVVMSAVIAASALTLTTPVYADGERVVTLGADLDQNDQNAILRYFGVLGQNVRIIYVTNQDEKNHLAGFIPMEQIGNRTISCAMVNPTRSGGIQVRTANLTYVTSNMIATTLSTSGVVNCEVLAAAPFEVTGTGALTGIMMAYEAATNTQLDPGKKEVATQELATTMQIADSVGQAQATEIVNEIKIEIIQNQIQDTQQVSQVVQEVVDNAEQNSQAGGLTDEDRQMLEDLAAQIAEQQYNYDDMKETLQRVETNVTDIQEQVSGIKEDIESVDDAGGTAEPEVIEVIEGSGDVQEQTEQPVTEEALASDSILLNTDDSALGENVFIDSTTQEALPETEAPADAVEKDWGFEITNEDTYAEGGEISDSASGEDVMISDPSFAEGTPDAAVTAETEMTDAFFDNTQGEEAVQPAEEGAEQGDAAVPAEEVPAENAAQSLVPGRSEINVESVIFHEESAGSGFIDLLVENADVAAEGTVTVTDSFGNQNVINLDPQNYAAVPLGANQLLDRSWAEGTRIVINAPNMFNIPGTYNISFNGRITKEGAAADLSASADVEIDMNGIAVSVDTLDQLRAGSQVVCSLILDPALGASYADIHAEGTEFGSMYAESNTTTVSQAEGVSDFTITLEEGTTVIYADIYDEGGNYIYSLQRTVNTF